MNIKVEKIFQSPDTPVSEVNYLIKIESPEAMSDQFEIKILEYLEEKSIEYFKGYK